MGRRRKIYRRDDLLTWAPEMGAAQALNKFTNFMVSIAAWGISGRLHTRLIRYQRAAMPRRPAERILDLFTPQGMFTEI